MKGRPDDADRRHRDLLAGEALATFLDTLEKATTGPVDVVLADNGSVDGSVDAAVQRPGVRVVPTGGNVGYGRAVNVGVAASTGEFVVVANPDVVWEPGSLDELLAAATRWPRAGSLGPLIRTVDGTVYPSARALPSLGRGIGHALCGWWWPSNPWTAAYRRERGEPAEGPTDWLSGSCLLVRRSAFDAVAGFDPAYFMYFEDVDLGERLGKAGWQNVYVPGAVVVHTGGHATARGSRADGRRAPPQRLDLPRQPLPGPAVGAAALGPARRPRRPIRAGQAGT